MTRPLSVADAARLNALASQSHMTAEEESECLNLASREERLGYAAVTPPALPGEMWRGVLNAGSGDCLYAVREHCGAARVNVWREGDWHVAVDDEWPIVLLAALRVYRERADAAKTALAELRRAVERMDSAYVDAYHYPPALRVAVDVARRKAR